MKTKNSHAQFKGITYITVMTFLLAIIFSFSSDILLKKSNVIIAFFILLLIVFIGIIFDMIGIAVATGDEKPFHSMAANKVYGAKQSIKLIRNVNIVTTFCMDVVGDISGIISGAALTTIIIKLSIQGTKSTIYFTILGGLLSAVTIAGKAIGKNIGINKNQSIIYIVGIFLAWIEKNIGINIFSDYRNKNRK
jgi:hypothetical protein